MTEQRCSCGAPWSEVGPSGNTCTVGHFGARNAATGVLEPTNGHATDARQSIDNYETEVPSWPDPIELFSSDAGASGIGPAPALDLALLPIEMANVAADVAERMQVPPDYVVWPLLVSTCGLIGRAAGIRPRAFDDWTEKLALWVAIIADSSQLKTPAINEGVRPLRRQQATDRQRFERAWEAWKIECNDARRANPKLKDADLRDPPEEFRWIVEDITIERLGILMTGESSRGLTMHRDELAGVLRDLNRYRGGGKGSDRQFLLEAYNGGPKRVDRVGRPALFVEDVLLNIVGGLQPDVAREMFSASVDDGLNARFTAIWPDPMPEWTPVDRWPNRAVRGALDRVSDALAGAPWADILLTDDFHPTPYARFDPEAQALWNEWYEIHMKGQLAAPDDTGWGSRRGKYAGLVSRLALAFHLHEWAAERTTDPRAVAATTLDRVLDLLDEYLVPMDRRVYRQFSDGPEAAGGRRIARYILEKRPASLTPREVYRNCWKGLKTPDEASKALEWLTAHLWLNELDPDGRPGIPSKLYGVNPKVWEKNHG